MNNEIKVGSLVEYRSPFDDNMVIICLVYKLHDVKTVNGTNVYSLKALNEELGKDHLIYDLYYEGELKFIC